MLTNTVQVSLHKSSSSSFCSRSSSSSSSLLRRIGKPVDVSGLVQGVPAVEDVGAHVGPVFLVDTLCGGSTDAAEIGNDMFVYRFAFFFEIKSCTKLLKFFFDNLIRYFKLD
jgi:hypothetical protein